MVPLHSALFRRLIWNVVPAIIVVGAVGMVLGGKEGLLKRHELKHQLVVMKGRTERLEMENDALRREIRALHSEPTVVQRAAAEALLNAAPGSTIYRFTD